MKSRLIWVSIWLTVGALCWLPLTSIALAFALHTLNRTNPWVLPFAAFFYWRDFRMVPGVVRWLPICAGGSAMLLTLPAWIALFWRGSVRRLRPARPGQPLPAPRRALSDLHGGAEWMRMDEAQRLFPGPHPVWGGVVVGEAYRVDQDKVAGIRFDPHDRTSWGRGGTAPLLIDPCTDDSTHGAVFTGSGGGKTTSIIIPTLMIWTGSAVVHDPSGQVGPMTVAMRTKLGQKAVMVGPGLGGFNVLDWIDPTDPLAEMHVRAMIEDITGDDSNEKQDENSMFRDRARELLTCLLADLLWDSAVPAARKTLREFRSRVRTPERKIRALLADIHTGSESNLARDLAGSLMDVYHETFSGIYSNAMAATYWLSIEAYASMVSEGSFQSKDLIAGDLTVYVQIPMDVLRTTPETSRVVIGALLRAVYRADGHLKGRVAFLLDEVNFLGRLKALSDARDAGRKYGITLVLMWHSIGQMIETWGRESKSAWFNACSWRQFAAVDDIVTAEEVSKTAGRYTVLARTEGLSISVQSGFSSGSRNRGSNQGLSEQPRDLIRPDEVRTRLRGDEAITFRRGATPLRHGRAFFFRRQDMAVAADRFSEAAE